MSLTDQAISVLNRPLPKEKIRTRPGGKGMEYSYITPDFVIELLNEAFGHNWSTRVIYHNVHEQTVVVGLRLTVPVEGDDKPITKEQFGSCEITRGLGVGEAFKGATSDAMKKCATLLGLGLELYKDDEPEETGPAPAPRFTPPKNTNIPRPPAAPARPAPAAPARPAPQAPAPAPVPAAAPVPRPPARPNPFPSAPAAGVSRPTPPAAPPRPPKVNPFLDAGGASDTINATQLSSLTNIAARKNMSSGQLIAMANITGPDGFPVGTFDELTYSQAIKVIQAAQAS